jgi:outer membrane protein assembly factor BamB
VAAWLALGTPAAAVGRQGTPLWISRVRNAGYPYANGVTADGSRVLVTGENGSTTAYDAETGARLWVAPRPGATFFGIASSPNSETVFLVGSNGTAFLTVAYDAATGVQRWASTYAGPTGSGASGAAIGVSGDGSTVFVTGWAAVALGTNFATLAYDAADGAQLWVTLYDGGHFGDYAVDLAVKPDDQAVFVTGPSTGNAYNDYATVAYDAMSGTQLWAARYNSGGTRGDTPYAIGISPDGSLVFVTGCSGTIDFCVDADFVTVGLDASTGGRLWVARFDGPGHGADSASDLAVSPDGTLLYVTGAAEGKTSYDEAVVAYDPETGSRVWVAAYRGAGNENDYPCCVAVTPDSSQVIVAGDTGVDWATASFDATSGQQLWSATYDGPAHGTDLALALAVSPDSSAVFVSGTSVSQGYDFTTIAYSA